MVKLLGTLSPLIVGHIPRDLIRSICFTITNRARISAVVLSRKAKNSPLVQGGLEISISIKAELKNEINLEHLKANVSRLGYSLEDDYVDNSKKN